MLFGFDHFHCGIDTSFHCVATTNGLQILQSYTMHYFFFFGGGEMGWLGGVLKLKIYINKYLRILKLK